MPPSTVQHAALRAADSRVGATDGSAGSRRVVRADAFLPVETKLRPPIVRQGCVQRGELVDRLREAEAPVVLLTAPAGYGKSTTLAQWAAEDERPFTWLSLDDDDNDPRILLAYLVLALQRVEPLSTGVLAAMSEDPTVMASVTLPRLGALVRQRSRPFVLVLDNVHALATPAAHALLGVLVQNLSAGSQIALAGRRSTSLPWHQLRLEQRLVEVGPDDLRLTPDESASLVEGLDLSLSPEARVRLLARTDGWAAGLYLAGLAVRAGATEGAGDDEVLAQYLREEVLQSLPEQVQDFLVQVSLLDVLSGPLCDAVLGTTGSGVLLAQLSAENLFLSSLDLHGEWYRLHDLFRDMLRGEQRRRAPGRTRLLHARASRWLEQAGDAAGSIRHAQLARELSRAAHLVWAEVPQCTDSGDHSALESWLDGFSGTEVMGQARLALSAAWLAVMRGRAVEPWVTAAERGAYDATVPGEPEAVSSATALLRAVLAEHGVVRMGAEARLAARLQSPADPWRCTATYLVAVSQHLTGQRAEAAALLEETVSLAAVLDVHVAAVLARTQQALLALESNDWQRCEELGTAAIAVLDDRGLDAVPALAVVVCLKTLLLSKAGQVTAARRESRRALRLLALNVQVAPWYAVQSRYLLARAHLILSDSAATRMLLSEAQAALADIPDAPVLNEQLDELWRQVEHSPLVHAGLSTLTTAELRVLQYLPTHLSFEQISQRLNVSRNTVKTQAIAGYRKLGVVSRAEAVESGYALGLIQGTP